MPHNLLISVLIPKLDGGFGKEGFATGRPGSLRGLVRRREGQLETALKRKGDIF
jgi:hypothetical protein